MQNLIPELPLWSPRPSLIEQANLTRFMEQNGFESFEVLLPIFP